MERIDFEITKSETEEPKEVIEAYICLHDEYLQYKVDYYLDERDESLGLIEDKYVFFDQYASKDAVRGVDIHYKYKANKWVVNVYLVGFTEDIWVSFYKESAAKMLFNKIMAWKYPSFIKPQ